MVYDTVMKMTNIEKKRLYNSMAISTAIHLCILLVIASITFAAYAITSKFEKPIVVQYVSLAHEHETIYRVESNIDKKVPSYTEIVDLKKNEKNQDVKKEESTKKKEDEVPVSVQNSSIKRVQEERREEKIDFDSQNFHKCSSKLKWDNDLTLRELEEIKDYFSELHIVKFLPRRSDALVIDSYLNQRHHVLRDITKEDIGKYPLDAKTIQIRKSSQLYSCVKKMVESENCDIDNYVDIYMLIPKSHWIQIFSCCGTFLSNYSLSLNDDKVRQVCIRYVKSGQDYNVEVLYIEIEKDGKIVRIDN